MKRVTLKLLLLLSFGLLSGSAQAQTPHPDSIDLEPFSLTLKVGETGLASAKIYDQFGLEINAPLAWVSSPNSCASVDAEGHVMGLVPGQCRIGAIAAGDNGLVLPRVGLSVTVIAVSKRRVQWPTSESAQDQIVADQWQQGYRFVRNLDGRWAEFELVR
jgi:uncharacterized protein YjdB